MNLYFKLGVPAVLGIRHTPRNGIQMEGSNSKETSMLFSCANASLFNGIIPGGGVVKNLPVNARDTEKQVQSLGREDPPEKGTATHFSIHAWRSSWTEEPGSYSPWDQRESDMTE